MAQWGRNDQSVTANSTTTVESSNGAPIGTYALVKGDQVNRVDGANAHFGNTSAGSRASVDVNMFGNTTMGAFIPGKAVGVFGVGANAGGAAAIETNVTAGSLATAVVVSKGTGYGANAAVTLTVTNGGTSGVVNAHANSTTQAGKIDSLLISTAGSGYVTAPTVAIAAPAAISINANTAGVVAAQNFIKVSTANSIWQSGDHLYYGVAAGNTAIAGLTGNTNYWVSFANTTGIVLAATQGGANVVLTEARVTASETGHTIQGDTATGAVTVGGVYSKGVAHAGWVLRTEGSGGRAGRVQLETLVAMGSLGAQTAAYGTPALVADASDDTIVPNA
jgi:hypothetical protein